MVFVRLRGQYLSNKPIGLEPLNFLLFPTGHLPPATTYHNNTHQLIYLTITTITYSIIYANNNTQTITIQEIIGHPYTVVPNTHLLHHAVEEIDGAFTCLGPRNFLTLYFKI